MCGEREWVQRTEAGGRVRDRKRAFLRLYFQAFQAAVLHLELDLQPFESRWAQLHVECAWLGARLASDARAPAARTLSDMRTWVASPVARIGKDLEQGFTRSLWNFVRLRSSKKA